MRNCRFNLRYEKHLKKLYQIGSITALTQRAIHLRYVVSSSTISFFRCANRRVDHHISEYRFNQPSLRLRKLPINHARTVPTEWSGIELFYVGVKSYSAFLLFYPHNIAELYQKIVKKCLRRPNSKSKKICRRSKNIAK